MNSCNVNAYEYDCFNETMHEITFFLNREISNLMNCLFYENMKGQTL